MAGTEQNIFAAQVMNISKNFGSAMVLDNVTFDVSEGEIIVLLGASGSGKTTILRIIAGLESPDAGKVILHGKDVTNLPARLRGTGVIFQAYASVSENECRGQYRLWPAFAEEVKSRN